MVSVSCVILLCDLFRNTDHYLFMSLENSFEPYCHSPVFRSRIAPRNHPSTYIKEKVYRKWKKNGWVLPRPFFSFVIQRRAPIIRCHGVYFLQSAQFLRFKFDTVQKIWLPISYSLLSERWKNWPLKKWPTTQPMESRFKTEADLFNLGGQLCI